MSQLRGCCEREGVLGSIGVRNHFEIFVGAGVGARCAVLHAVFLLLKCVFVRAGFWCARLLWLAGSFECTALRVKLFSLAIRGLPCDVLLCFVLQQSVPHGQELSPSVRRRQVIVMCSAS